MADDRVKNNIVYAAADGAKCDDAISMQIDDDEVSVSVRSVHRDESDIGSSWSLFMTQDLRYYLQHPYFRLFLSYCVIFCNFFIYAEDPISHSQIEGNVPFIGNSFSLFFTKYPDNNWSIVKVMMSLIGVGSGIYIGHIVHRNVLNNYLHLQMFSDHKGSWMCMFLCSMVTSFVVSNIYTGLLIGAGEYTTPYRISHYLGMTNARFMRIAAIGTWVGDVLTACMVTDIMLQDRLYPHWAPGARAWWRQGYRRIYIFWPALTVSTVMVVLVITTDYIQWDHINKDLFHTGELSRGFLASAITIADFTIVVQDWDFPHFVSNFDIKLPGFNIDSIKITILDKIHIHITGKWFNYGISFFVMFLDLNMWKNQILYVPYAFGQYTGPDHKVYTPRDAFTLANLDNATYYNFHWRNSTIDPLTNRTYISADAMTHSKYHHTRLAIKAIAFIPTSLMLVSFVCLVAKYGRENPTFSNPYLGRLHKRRKRGKGMDSVMELGEHEGLRDSEGKDAVVEASRVGEMSHVGEMSVVGEMPVFHEITVSEMSVGEMLSETLVVGETSVVSEISVVSETSVVSERSLVGKSTSDSDAIYEDINLPGNYASDADIKVSIADGAGKHGRRKRSNIKGASRRRKRAGKTKPGDQAGTAGSNGTVYRNAHSRRRKRSADRASSTDVVGKKPGKHRRKSRKGSRRKRRLSRSGANSSASDQGSTKVRHRSSNVGQRSPSVRSRSPSVRSRSPSVLSRSPGQSQGKQANMKETEV